MKKNFLGIDIGSSSVKALLLCEDGRILKCKQNYKEISLNGWRDAIKSVLKNFSDKNITAVSFCSQVGTYILDDKKIIEWNSSAGKEQLKLIKNTFTKEEFIEEISMNHPDIISYPLPRYLYVKQHYPNVKKICMPKEYFIEQLTGNYVTDQYSMRGIANLKTNEYSKKLLEKFNAQFNLPKIIDATAFCGYVSERAEKEFFIKKGTPVFVGCNDFFAGLLGMGIIREGQSFDLSGTSEHFGLITEDLIDTNMVSGPYFYKNATYGGTKSSGVSCAFAMENFGLDEMDFREELEKNPPIFLPYLTGERAPIFDENARGVFFGISNKTDKKALAYSVLEGVLFSLYDIADNLGDSKTDCIICGGGSTVNAEFSKMKATLFGKRIINAVEKDVSALGAALIAMVACGYKKDYISAVTEYVKYEESVLPEEKYRLKMLKRFEIFRSIYKNLKTDFEKFKEI